MCCCSNFLRVGYEFIFHHFFSELIQVTHESFKALMKSSEMDLGETLSKPVSCISSLYLYSASLRNVHFVCEMDG